MFKSWRRKKKSAKEEPGFSATGVSTSGAVGISKSAIGFIPYVGSAINTMIDEAKKAKDNEDAKQQLIVEIKYSILLIESCTNLLKYIQTKKLTTQLCDVKIITDMNDLIQKTTNMLKNLRKDDAIKFQTNKEIEGILISNYSQHLSKDLSPEERQSAVFNKKQEIASNFCERSLKDEDVPDLIERINTTSETLKFGTFLLNEGLGRDRMFYTLPNGDKNFLKLETFLEQCGFSNFSSATPKEYFDQIFTSNVAKYLRNKEKIREWFEKDEIFIDTNDEQKMIVFILNMFLMEFTQESLEPFYEKILSAQNFLFTMDTYKFGVLLQVLNDPSYVSNVIERWKSSLQCIHRGTSIPETRFDPNEFLSKIVIVSDFVNFRINLNIVATQLNSLYQDLLFQVLQLKTMDPATEELLCPTFSMSMFR